MANWKEIGDRIDGARTGAYAQFATQAGEVRKMKVAISYVSEAQARLNLNTELPHWDFKKPHKTAVATGTSG